MRDCVPELARPPCGKSRGGREPAEVTVLWYQLAEKEESQLLPVRIFKSFPSFACFCLS